MIPHPTRAACSLLALFVSAAGAPLASAGPVLLERASDIRASGASASGEYQLSNGSADFAAFTDGLLSSDEAAARSAAQQHSSPTLDAAGVLSGASAEGSARASVDFGVEDAFSNAETDFDLVFRVEGAPALFTFDATLAATGDAQRAAAVKEAEQLDHHPQDEHAQGVVDQDHVPVRVDEFFCHGGGPACEGGYTRGYRLPGVLVTGRPRFSRADPTGVGDSGKRKTPRGRGV